MTKFVFSLVLFAFAAGLCWVVGSHPMVAMACLAFGLNWVAFLPAWLKKTEHFYDLVGSLTYMALVGTAFLYGQTKTEGLSWVHLGTAGLVLVWAARLGSFLFLRIKRDGKDGRFDRIKTHGPSFFFAWSLQGLWALLTSFGVLIVLTKAVPNTPPLLTVIGWLIWLLGFSIEVTADRQKSRFRRNPDNRGAWIDEGLWRWSQHPNYFGEMLLWTGLFIAGIPFYEGLEWLALLSPLFVTGLLAKGSGIPLLQARAQERWGNDPAYQAYLTRTRLLIPLPTKRPS